MSTPTGASRRSRLLALTPLTALPLVLAGCGAGGSTGTGAAAPPSAAETSSAAPATEQAASTPRLVLTHDGGVTVLDATTLEEVGEAELPGYLRLNPAGDGRHVMVTSTGGFRVLDAGTWAEPHGDHDHYWTSDPALTELTYAAEEPGHVVVHGGRTVLFDDGTGAVVAVDSAEVADPGAERRELATPAAHHGVAVELSDGSLVVSEGTEEARTGIRVLDASGDEVSRNDSCPGVHGEAVAAEEAVVIGCTDGALVHTGGLGGTTTKVQAPDAYGRIGNQAGHEGSPYVLGDYKSDGAAAEAGTLERPTRVSIIDTRDASLRLVDLPASYTFRSLARGEDGEALVLGTDGALHVIDPESATVARSVPVIGAWTEPEEWQEARPAVRVHEGTAYVTDPATRSVHAVDVATGEVFATTTLDVVPDEIAVATGEAPEGGKHDHAHGEHEGEHDHAHEDASA
ncbi:zinc metallochaperone AztD [Quadrisphaera sp. KR29]|uniref:zinc metallochaperone AztD n=1 Tax=Quadrisphaera sp. KR29 TaxID=3461391 RepID=UPI0040439C8E